MNTDTGRIYEGVGADLQDLLKERAASLDTLTRFDHPDDGDLRTNLVAARMLGRQLNADEQAMAYEAARGDNIVPVSGDVAHTMKLGLRERERRSKRRKAEKQARKRNR